MRQSAVAIRNSMFGLASQAVSTVIALALAPYIIRRIGTADYTGEQAFGVYLLAFGLLTAVEAIRDAVARTNLVTVARCRESGDYGQINRTVSASVLAMLVAGVLCLLVLGGGGEVVFRLLEITPSLHAQTLLVMLIVGVTGLVSFPMHPYQGVVWGSQRMDIAYSVMIAMNLLRLVAIVAIFQLGGANVLVVAAATAGALVGTQLVTMLFAGRILPQLQVSLRGVRREDFSSLVRFGGYLVIAQVLVSLDVQVFQWVAGRTLGVGAVTLLWFNMVVLDLSIKLVQQVGVVLVPVAARYHELKQGELMQQTLRQGSRIAVMVASVALCGLLPCMDVFLSLWQGPQYAWLAPYGVIIGCVAIVTTSSNCAYQMLQGMGNSRASLVATASSLAGGATTAIVACGPLGLGYGGLIAGVAVSQLLRWGVLMALAKRHIGGSMLQLGYRAYLQPVAAFVLAAGAVVLLRYVVDALQWRWGWLMLLAMMAGGVLLYALAVCPMLSAFERQLLRELLVKLRLAKPSIKQPGDGR